MTKRFAIAGAVGAVALALAGCSSADDKAEGAAPDAGGEKGTITLGYIPSWTDGLSTACLLEHQLGEMGYTVEHKQIEDAAVLYAGLSKGDVDVYPSAWSERTHASYMDKYGDNVEDISAYYDGASLNLSVPEYMDIETIEDLKGAGDRFDGKIIGIEPGAGLTKATEEEVIPGYELDEYQLVTSSTPAMLAELKKAVENEDDIVVTLWKPFWANAEFPVKALEDPKGAFGEHESLHFLGREGFADDNPEAYEYIKNIRLDDDQYGSLEDIVVNVHDGCADGAAIEEWIAENPGVLPETN